MKKVYIYVTNGVITVETEDHKVLHTMSGFKSTALAYKVIDSLEDEYEIMEIFS